MAVGPRHRKMGGPVAARRTKANGLRLTACRMMTERDMRTIEGPGGLWRLGDYE
jgi:hypothetical protein